MGLAKLLVANRGEIAVRVMRTARELDLLTVALHSRDEADALHTRMADEVVVLDGEGPGAFLDAAALVGAAVRTGCDAVHPGYGLLAENADFAQRCADAGLTWVGPRPEVLRTLGDKTAARELAARLGVPVLPATYGDTGIEEARAFMAGLGDGAAVMVKAVAGGGGRGMRAVYEAGQLEEAVRRCRSEASHAFGDGAVYVEQLLRRARHVEVQVLGDGTGAVVGYGDRDCSLQRHRQKIVEIASAPGLDAAVRAGLHDAALRMAREVAYAGLGTFEFLVDTGDGSPGFYFLEANPRIQVEHTVTEEVTGIDLVKAQLRVASGERLDRIGAGQAPVPRGCAVQVRVNAETVRPDGTVLPSAGTLDVFWPPAGPGVRVDTAAFPGGRVSPRFDSLLAKLVAHDGSGSLPDTLARARRALAELRVEGVATNTEVLLRLLEAPEVVAGRLHTALLDELLPTLVPQETDEEKDAEVTDALEPQGTLTVTAPMTATVVDVAVAEGERVRAGSTLVVLESMKMEHLLQAPGDGVVVAVRVELGELAEHGQPLVVMEATGEADGEPRPEERPDPDAPRADLEEVRARKRFGDDADRPEMVTRRHAEGRRTARENIADLCDPGSFVEYGGLAMAAQRSRRSLDDLIRRTPADGLVGGVGTVGADRFGPRSARVVAMSYDYSVMAGTQGMTGHRKKDRLFALAEQAHLPVVLFAEGGGGRPGDVDGTVVSGLDCMAFALFASLNGKVPLVGIGSGRCFAGNAALLGCCDVIIATPEATIGMGGPAMIEGGGLGSYAPEDIGPVEVQRANGVIDLDAEDDADAVRLARTYLSYFQGPVTEWECPDQRRLRHLIPENRRRAYDVRAVIATLADADSVLELRRHFGRGVITALARVEGRPCGILANDPRHLGGAIDSDAADKASRFLQLCDAFGLPVVSLCDTPGFMVGPEAEKTATVRHVSRMFVHASALTVPFGVIVLRKGYGLGAQAMAGGGFRIPRFTVAWPTGEFGPMGIEGAVRLGYRRELAAIEDADEREREFARRVAAAYEHGKALNVASVFEIDDVIDPAESRRWISTLLHDPDPDPDPEPGQRGSRRCVDTW
ncbi:carboxyl transferase domain-containing protein [Streptomyces sp. T12]|uniref:carboxyl transferase domain-containing protein n=2 Tax=unclassified Streptomyces TaxID=2593676 RepID=UPI002365C3F3|nr:carboxyl transferase domain-containing protein [Streptomyces sp. T12]WDF43340.1 carboxyl transferase domain-containing protein [Streptomyces sp. T12]